MRSLFSEYLLGKGIRADFIRCSLSLYEGDKEFIPKSLFSKNINKYSLSHNIKRGYLKIFLEIPREKINYFLLKATLNSPNLSFPHINPNSSLSATDPTPAGVPV